MKFYIKDAITYFGNQNINNYIDLIINDGTEGDKQINVYNKLGFDGLKQYLMESVEY